MTSISCWRGAPNGVVPPRLGPSVESVRLDPELRDQLLQRARSEGMTTSEVTREALRRFLRAAEPDCTVRRTPLTQVGVVGQYLSSRSDKAR